LEGYLDSGAEKLRTTVTVCGREDTVSPSEQRGFMDCRLITAEGCVGNQHARTERKCWFVCTVKKCSYYLGAPFAFISRLVLVERR